MKYQFSPDTRYTKKMIAELTKLSHNTISATLSLARLSTGQRAYTGKELERFVLVRMMLESGMTKAEVKEQINLRTADTEEGSDATYSQAPATTETSQVTADFAGIDRAIGEGVQDALTGLVEAAVTDFVDHLPGITAVVLAQAAESGRIRAAFTSKLKEYYQERGARALMPSSAGRFAEPLALEFQAADPDDDGADIPLIEEADNVPQDDREAGDKAL